MTAPSSKFGPRRRQISNLRPNGAFRIGETPCTHLPLPPMSATTQASHDRPAPLRGRQDVVDAVVALAARAAVGEGGRDHHRR